MKPAVQWVQALVFPVLIAAVVGPGLWLLRPDPPAPIQTWLPAPATVSYVEFERRLQPAAEPGRWVRQHHSS